MPDYNIATQVQVPDAMKSIGSLINFAGGAQNLQRGAVELQKSRETMQADIDRARALSRQAGAEARVSEETADPRISQAKTAAGVAQWHFDAEQGKTVQKIMGGLLVDPAVEKGDSAGIVNALMNAEHTMRGQGIPEAKIRAQLAPAYLMATLKPGEFGTHLKNMVGGGIEPSGQAQLVQPQYLPTGGAFKPTNPFAPSAPAPVPATVPPTAKEEPGTDALGRPIIKAKDAAGAITFKPPPGSSYKPLMTLPPGETPQTAVPLLALRDQAQAAAAAVPNQHFNNDKILKLADTAFTGTGSKEFSQILNSVGLQRITGDAAKDTAQLQHFISLQIENNAAAQGANTDAARQLAAQAVLPGNTPGQTIKAITKINDAYATGTELFNRGIQSTLAHPNNTKDVYAIRDFQNAWTANMDPRIFQLENASKAGDKAEIERIKKDLGPDGIKQLAIKARNLQNLIHNGAVGGP